jgi:2-keto-3-deoxy-L-rhamnonate aldolase RhmA
VFRGSTRSSSAPRTSAPRWGRSGEAEDPEVQDAIDHIRTVAARHGVASGIHVFSPEAVAQRIQEGFRLIALATDARFMTGGAKAALSRYQRMT